MRTLRPPAAAIQIAESKDDREDREDKGGQEDRESKEVKEVKDDAPAGDPQGSASDAKGSDPEEQVPFRLARIDGLCRLASAALHQRYAPVRVVLPRPRSVELGLRVRLVSEVT